MRTRWQILRVYLLRWHRRLGIALALLLIWLALTGIALNHSVGLGLDKRPVAVDWIAGRYRGELPEPVSFAVGKHWLSATGGGQLYLDTRVVGHCPPPLVGALPWRDMLIAACRGGLIVVTSDGKLVERIDEVHGAPIPLDRIGSAADNVMLSAGGGLYRVDLDALEFVSASASEGDVRWSRPADAPAAIGTALVAHFLGDPISWERALLDLHSGRLFGDGGVLFADVLAVGMVLLAASGAWVWSSKPGRWRRHHD